MNEKTARPSIQDVARLAGVSIGTVSNVLNNPDRVKPDTLAKVQRAIEQLGFVRNDAARQLKAGRSKTLGLVVPDIGNPFFSDIARGAEQASADHGYSVIVGSDNHSREREAAYLTLFEEQRAGGVIISPIDDVSETVLRLRDRGTAAVLVDRRADPSIACSVSMDDVAGGKLAVQHLIEQGCKRIMMVGGPAELQQIADRLIGARAAITEAGADISFEYLPTRELSVLVGREQGERLASLGDHARPDGIFAANDLLAVGILQAFMFRSRVRVPQDIALVGYDDIDFAAAAIVPLSSIRQPGSLLGSKAVELVFQENQEGLSHKHAQLTFQPEIVVRESSRRRENWPDAN